ncbi:MAG: chondroitin AC lyase [Cyclobacteriaceae bacterium]
MCQLAFYQSGKVEIAPSSIVKMDSQGMMILKLKDDRVAEISVADPSRKLKRALVTIPGIYKDAKEGYLLYPDASGNNTLMIVDLPQGVYAGKSVTITL